MIVLWTAAAFLAGSLMFSYWIGRMKRFNLKTYGDGNPGAINLWKAAGYGYGIAGIILDFAKGYLPMLWLHHSGAVTGFGMVLPAAAVILGHIFSPFTGWKGGKAIAVTFGVWSGLTGFEASLAYAVILAVLLLASKRPNKDIPTHSETDAFHVVLGMLLLTIYLVLDSYAWPYVLLGMINFLLLAYSHRKELIAVKDTNN
ncbi:acyl-phosphate glycerol 3-phosphate acyltransferase [Paenibacillus catalpae]|uniref:Acyl-phosphate glycerol 3-phosphate acyltransferase n=1 Tax=Paenibacillus catalpae TaxID=1045775 RepID=A0A1I2E5N6_9BACL|nr:glycerol-3-phosphate acyltransferase [Paenibacillus catalpae]SFE88027.1 acyl-phosphate glycerol 3-phosphate acyltransferase [Paenibacillus catalpae]